MTGCATPPARLTDPTTALQAAGGGLRRVERKYMQDPTSLKSATARTAHADFSLAEALVDSRDAAMPGEHSADIATRSLQRADFRQRRAGPSRGALLASQVVSTFESIEHLLSRFVNAKTMLCVF
jgi:hypothetical protein